MTTRFVIKPHSVREGTDMVEVFVGDQFVGALYAGERENELRFMSKHLVSIALDEAYPPAVDIFLSLEGSRQ
jgi:hypothetical protein